MVENFGLEKGKSVDLEYRYYISSKELSAEQSAMAVRELIMSTSYELEHAPRRVN